MLTIRTLQIEAFQRYMLAQFIAQMAQHLRAIYPEKTTALSEVSLKSEIKAGIDKAATYEIQRQFDIQQFLEHWIELGTDFDTRSEMAWAGEILNDERLTPTEKMDVLGDRTSFLEVA